MELSYWVNRWNKGKTGFHMKDGYPGLKRHWPELNLLGPPFSVSIEEIKQYFDCHYQITELEGCELNLSNFEKFRHRGLKTNFFEFLLLLSRK